MAEVIVCAYDVGSNGELILVGSSAKVIPGEPTHSSNTDMNSIVFAYELAGKATYVSYTSESGQWVSGGTPVTPLAGKPVGYTAYDGGSTYSVGTLTSGAIHYQEDGKWIEYGSASYTDVKSTPVVSKLLATGYTIDGIMFF